jgi:hypothetical protein
MSVELPALEQLLADAAQRHYGGRRSRLRWPRPALVTGLVAAAAAVALAIAVLPIRLHDNSGSPAGDPVDRLYSVFARPEPHRSALERRVIAGQSLVEPGSPIKSRLLRRFDDGGGIVALVGKSLDMRGRTLCLYVEHKTTGGGGCADLSRLLAKRRPWFTFGTFGRTQKEVVALVPDDIRSVRIKLKSGATRDIRIESNLAYVVAGERVCRVEWTAIDGRTGHDRSVFGC